MQHIKFGFGGREEKKSFRYIDFPLFYHFSSFLFKGAVTHTVTLNAWPQSVDHRSDYFLSSGHWQCNAS